MEKTAKKREKTGKEWANALMRILTPATGDTAMGAPNRARV